MSYYLNSEVVENYIYPPEKTENKSFEFNLESNGRLHGPIKFEIKNIFNGEFELCSSCNEWLIFIGNIELCKMEKKEWCRWRIPSDINFDENKNALCIGNGFDEWDPSGIYFIPKRIVVIQMK